MCDGGGEGLMVGILVKEDMGVVGCQHVLPPLLPFIMEAGSMSIMVATLVMSGMVLRYPVHSGRSIGVQGGVGGVRAWVPRSWSVCVSAWHMDGGRQSSGRGISIWR